MIVNDCAPPARMPATVTPDPRANSSDPPTDAVPVGRTNWLAEPGEKRVTRYRPLSARLPPMVSEGVDGEVPAVMVAPAATVTALAMLPIPPRVPADTVVGPLYVFVPFKSSVPAWSLVSPCVPLMFPLTVSVWFASTFHLWTLEPTRDTFAVIVWLPEPASTSRVGWPVPVLSRVKLPPVPGARVTEPVWSALNISLRRVTALSSVMVLAESFPSELTTARTPVPSG